jgi:hypothetical protein
MVTPARYRASKRTKLGRFFVQIGSRAAALDQVRTGLENASH